MGNDKENLANNNGGAGLSPRVIGRILLAILFSMTAWTVINTHTLVVDVARLQERLNAIENAIAEGKDENRDIWRRLNGRAADRP